MNHCTLFCRGRAALAVSAAVVAVLAAGAPAQAADTASVTFNITLNPGSLAGINATVTATLKEGSTQYPPVTATGLTGVDIVVKLPLQKTTGVLYDGQNRRGVPVISAGRDGRVALRLSPQSYNNADIALFSIDGRRVLQGKAPAADAGGLSVSRANVARGVYLLSVKGANGDEFSARLAHNGGTLNIDVAYGGENLSPAAKMAKQAAVGDWTIKVSAGGYADSTYVLNPENVVTPKQTITLKAAVTLPPVTTRSWTNVDYAPAASRRHARQRYDIKLPSSGNGPFPLLIYVHGGGFSGGDWELSKNNNGLVSRANSNGYAVASVGYLLMGQSGWSGGQRAFPENVEDVLAAVRHLRANAGTYHIDPDKFAVSGFSAGAYMTAIVCALSNAQNHGYNITYLGNAGVSHAVQAAASTAALTDFSLLETHESQNTGVQGMLDHDASPEGAMLGGNLKNDKDKEPMKTYLRMQNPLTHISANTPPIYMVHGTSDNLVPWQQSEIMVNKINGFVADRAKFDKVSGRGHADFDGASDARTIAILNFLDKALGVTR